MPLQHDYQRVAKRSLHASAAALNVGIQEKSAFLSYHAFESSGCALCVVVGLPVGPQVRHNDKILNFVRAANQLGHGHAVRSMSITLSSIRNHLLYPVRHPATGAVTRPEDAITVVQAKKLQSKVQGIVNWVGTQI